MIDEHNDAAANMVRRGRLLSVDDRGTQQLSRVRGVRGETLDEVHRIQQPGLSHVPMPESEGLLLALGGRSDRAVFFGGENPKHRPTGKEPGDTILYDSHNNAISLIKSAIRIVHSGKVVISAPEIVLDGLVKLGGEDASKPASMQGTIDTGGYADTSNLATRVLVK